MKYFTEEQPALMPLVEYLSTMVERTDVWRYVILLHVGGIYADSDVVAIRPIDEWNGARDANTTVILGVEANVNSAARQRFGLAHNVQFCQWTMAAAPGHWIFKRVLQRIHQRVQGEKDGSIRGTSSREMDILYRTGPGIWSDAVNDYLANHNARAADVVRGHQTRRVGDVTVLPVSAFAPNQDHSGARQVSSRDPSIYAQHMFLGSWRGVKHRLLHH